MPQTSDTVLLFPRIYVVNLVFRSTIMYILHRYLMKLQ